MIYAGSVRRLRLRGPLWRNRDFLRLWSAQTVSQFGSQVTTLALPFVAILVLKASTFEIAALGVVEFLPFVFFSLPAGVWVDRLRRRPILIAADWGRAIALVSVPAAYAVGVLTLGQLYLVAFVTGVLTVFFDVSYQSYLPSLVQRDEIAEGNSKLEVTRSAAQVAGPGIAGVLVGALTAPYAILVDASSFVGSALFMTGIKRTELRATSERAVRRKMRAEIAEGLGYVLRHPLMRPMMIWVAISNFFTSIIFSILLVYAVRFLHLSAATVGLVFSLGNIGVLAGALVATRMARRLGIGRTLVGLAVSGGFAFLLVPLASGSRAIPFLVVAQFVFGFSAVAVNINGISLLQAITPDRLLGRMNASRRFVVWGVMPFGSLIGGALGSHLGLRATMWFGASGASLAFIVLVFSPVRRVQRTEDAEEMVRGINEEFALRTAESPTTYTTVERCKSRFRLVVVVHTAHASGSRPIAERRRPARTRRQRSGGASGATRHMLIALVSSIQRASPGSDLTGLSPDLLSAARTRGIRAA
jgi:MFS family permease